MSPLVFGIGAGVVWGAHTVPAMQPLSFPGRTVALSAAFASRFAIGFLVPLVRMALQPGWRGALVGLLVSIPAALVAGAYLPVIPVGALGGALIAWLAGRFVGRVEAQGSMQRRGDVYAQCAGKFDGWAARRIRACLPGRLFFLQGVGHVG